MTTDLNQLFNQLQDHEKEMDKNKGDDRLITFKPGNTYVFRLLFIPSKDGRRKTPWIHNRTHTYSNKETKQYDFQVCPSSEYLLGGRGYNVCPMCKEASKYFDEFSKTKSKSAEELKNLYASIFNGFIPVYVISDPSKPENNGKVKIMRYGKTIKDYIKKKVLGRDEKNKEIVGYEPIGAKAFDIQNGHNFIITVTKPENWNKYETEFSNGTSSINVDSSHLTNMCNMLRFDEDFLTDYKEQDLYKFMKTYLGSPETAPVIETKSVANNVPEEKIDVMTTNQTPVPHNGTSPAPKCGVSQTPVAPTTVSATSSNIDKELEDMLKGIQ